ncbi:hypothetical protein Ac2012v2_004894 [Leucoagaricus gongylophorus]
MLGLLKALVRLLCGKQPPVEKPDYQPAPADYALLRSQAADEGDAMARCFEESHQAYSRGDGALAKELSNKGKQHQTCMQELNRQASECIFIENNKDNKPHEVDLHGLYVKEAISYTDRALEQARARGDKELRLIVGKGLHSKNGAKIKPAIEQLVHKYQLSAQLDSTNTGILIVQLDSIHHGIGDNEIMRRIDDDDNGCIIM